MIKQTSFSFLFLFLILLITGCSATKSSPVIPDNPQADINLPATELNTGESQHSILGTWTLSINPESLEVKVEPDRVLNAHHNVTDHIPTPEVVINSWDPVEEIIDVDVTLENPILMFNAFDVRLIIYTDDAKHMLVNEDNWTRLWDIPGGQVANPFKAYAKEEPQRMFTGGSSHSENLRIRCPGSDFSVRFAVDASYPGNCEEPYKISNFNQTFLGESIGSTAYASVEVFHWQDNVSEVYLRCPEITGEAEIPFEQYTSNKWSLNLRNSTGAAVGWYQAWIYAVSQGLGNLEMIKRVKIYVSEGTGIPSDPQFAGKICLMKDAYNVYPNENLACVFNWDHILFVDISNPSNPKIIGSYYHQYLMQGYSLHFLGDLLLLVGSRKYIILDITYPKNPVKLYELELYHGVTDAVVRDDFMFLVVKNTWDYIKLMIYDISDPFNPVEMSRMVNYQDIADIELKDDYAYIISNGGMDDSLRIVDISDYSNPQVVASIEINDDSYDFEIYGNYIYLESSLFLHVIDITDPLNPEFINEFDIMDHPGLEVDGNHLYTFTDSWSITNYLNIYNLDNPENPTLIGSMEMYKTRDISIQDNLVYVGDIFDGFKIVDVSDPSNPQLISHIPTINNITDIAVNNGHAYITTDGLFRMPIGIGMQVYDISDLSNPDYLSSMYEFESKTVEFFDDYAYVGADTHVYSIDVSDPSLPFVASRGLANQYPRYLAFEGNTAIAACSLYVNTHSSQSTIFRYDVTDPTDIVQTGFVDTFPLCLDSAAISGNYAYVMSYQSGLLVLDISDPAFIEIVATFDEIKKGQISVQGNYLFHNFADFLVYDINDPINPQLLASIPSPRCSGLVVSGNYAYITGDGYLAQLTTIDITDPLDPYIFSTMDLDDSRYVLKLKKYENYLYLIMDRNTPSDQIIDVVRLW